MSDVEVRFGATAAPMEPGVNAAKGQLNGFRATAEGMGASFRGIMEGMVAGLVELGGAATGSFRQVSMGAQQAGHEVKGAAESVTEFREAIAGIGEAIIAAFAVEQIIEFAKKMAEAAEQTYKVALTFGETTAEVQRMNAEFTALGVAPEAGSRAMLRLDRAFATAKEGSKQTAAAFRALGVDLNGSYTQAQLMQKTLEGFASLSGPAKAATAVRLLGRNAIDLAPILGLTKERMAELNEEIERSGAVSDPAEQKALALAEAFNSNKLAMLGLSNVMADALAPALTSIVTGFAQLVNEFVESYNKGGAAKTTMEALSVVIKAAATAVVLLGAGLDGLIRIVVAAGQAVVGLAFVLGDTLAGAIAIAIDAAVTFARVMGDINNRDYTAAVRDAAAGWHAVADDFRHAGTAIANDAKTYGKAIGSNLMGGVKDGWNVDKFLAQMWTGKGGKPLPELPKAGTGTTGDLPAGTGKTAKGPGLLERWRADLAEALADEKNFGVDEAAYSLQFWTAKLALVRAGSKEEVAVRSEVARAKRAVMLEEQREELAIVRDTTNRKLEAAKSDADIAKIGIDAEKDAVDQRERLGQISATRAAEQRATLNARLRDLDRQEADAEFQIHLQELQDELKIDGLKPDAKAEINRQIEALEQQHADRMKQIDAGNARGAASDQGKVDESKAGNAHSWVDPVVGAWVSGMQAMEQATGSFRQMVLGIFDSIANTAIQKVGQMVTKWIVSHVVMRGVSTATKAADVATTTAAEAAKTGVVVAGEAVRTGAVVAGAATSKAVTLTSALSQIAAHAATAAAGAYAALAAIPVIGPVIAPIAAAAALVGVLALGRSLFSAEDGWGEVPFDGATTQLHKKEMVLPASIAEPLRASLKGGFALPGGGGGGDGAKAAGDTFRSQIANSRGGDIHLTHAPQITNPDPSLERLLDTQGRHMRKWIQNEVRNNPKTWGGAKS